MAIDTTVEPAAQFDLYQLRCAVAALVDCVNHRGLLNPAGLRRTDAAVNVLSAATGPHAGPLRRAVDRLLSDCEDDDGTRTIDAIAELAALTHVNTAAAPALAAALRPPPPPHSPWIAEVADGQPELDPQTAPITAPRPAETDRAPEPAISAEKTHP